MALSQLQCLDDNHINLRVHESKPEFLYCEDQRLALETLLRDGPEAFAKFLQERGLRGFLSDSELEALTGTVEPYDPNTELFPGSAEDGESALSLQYWPELSDTSEPQLDLGWPDSVSYRGVTRTSVYTQPPLEGHVHIKEIVRKTIAQAQKVIAVVMDVFTDVDIFRDLLDASFKKKVSVYILLERTRLPHFLSMCQRANMHGGHLKNLRVRCTEGGEFCTRSCAKVKGQLGHRFMFVDGDKAVSGTYSFTWKASRLDRNLITVVTGQAVDAFDRLFRILHFTSSSVDLRQIATEPEPVPEPLPPPAATPTPSAADARKLYSPKYSLLALGNPSLASSTTQNTQQNPKTPENPKNPEGPGSKNRRHKKSSKDTAQESPPLHPGLIHLEKVCLIPYLPTWPEPDPPSDVIGFINVRDSSKPTQVHLQRSEMFETSQAIRFSSPFSKPKEVLPEVAQPRQITPKLEKLNKHQNETKTVEPASDKDRTVQRCAQPSDTKTEEPSEQRSPTPAQKPGIGNDTHKTVNTQPHQECNTTLQLGTQTSCLSNSKTLTPSNNLISLNSQSFSTGSPKQQSLPGTKDTREADTHLDENVLTDSKSCFKNNHTALSKTNTDICANIPPIPKPRTVQLIISDGGNDQKLPEISVVRRSESQDSKPQVVNSKPNAAKVDQTQPDKQSTHSVAQEQGKSKTGSQNNSGCTENHKGTYHQYKKNILQEKKVAKIFRPPNDTSVVQSDFLPTDASKSPGVKSQKVIPDKIQHKSVTASGCKIPPQTEMARIARAQTNSKALPRIDSPSSKKPAKTELASVTTAQSDTKLTTPVNLIQSKVLPEIETASIATGQPDPKASTPIGSPQSKIPPKKETACVATVQTGTKALTRIDSPASKINPKTELASVTTVQSDTKPATPVKVTLSKVPPGIETASIATVQPDTKASTPIGSTESNIPPKKETACVATVQTDTKALIRIDSPASEIPPQKELASVTTVQSDTKPTTPVNVTLSKVPPEIETASIATVKPNTKTSTPIASPESKIDPKKETTCVATVQTDTKALTRIDSPASKIPPKTELASVTTVQSDTKPATPGNVNLSKVPLEIETASIATVQPDPKASTPIGSPQSKIPPKKETACGATVQTGTKALTRIDSPAPKIHPKTELASVTTVQSDTKPGTPVNVTLSKVPLEIETASIATLKPDTKASTPIGSPESKIPPKKDMASVNTVQSDTKPATPVNVTLSKVPPEIETASIATVKPNTKTSTPIASPESKIVPKKEMACVATVQTDTKAVTCMDSPASNIPPKTALASVTTVQSDTKPTTPINFTQSKVPPEKKRGSIATVQTDIKALTLDSPVSKTSPKTELASVMTIQSDPKHATPVNLTKSEISPTTELVCVETAQNCATSATPVDSTKSKLPPAQTDTLNLIDSSDSRKAPNSKKVPGKARVTRVQADKNTTFIKSPASKIHQKIEVVCGATVQTDSNASTLTDSSHSKIPRETKMACIVTVQTDGQTSTSVDSTDPKITSLTEVACIGTVQTNASTPIDSIQSKINPKTETVCVAAADTKTSTPINTSDSRKLHETPCLGTVETDSRISTSEDSSDSKTPPKREVTCTGTIQTTASTSLESKIPLKTEMARTAKVQTGTKASNLIDSSDFIIPPEAELAFVATAQTADQTSSSIDSKGPKMTAETEVACTNTIQVDTNVSSLIDLSDSKLPSETGTACVTTRQTDIKITRVDSKIETQVAGMATVQTDIKDSTIKDSNPEISPETDTDCVAKVKTYSVASALIASNKSSEKPLTDSIQKSNEKSDNLVNCKIYHARAHEPQRILYCESSPIAVGVDSMKTFVLHTSIDNGVGSQQGNPGVTTALQTDNNSNTAKHDAHTFSAPQDSQLIPEAWVNVLTPERPRHRHPANALKSDVDSPPAFKEAEPLASQVFTPTLDEVLPCTPPTDSQMNISDPRPFSPDFRTPTPDISDGYLSPIEDSALSTTSEEYYECSDSPLHDFTFDQAVFHHHGTSDDCDSFANSPNSSPVHMNDLTCAYTLGTDGFNSDTEIPSSCGPRRVTASSVLEKVEKEKEKRAKNKENWTEDNEKQMKQTAAEHDSQGTGRNSSTETKTTTDQLKQAEVNDGAAPGGEIVNKKFSFNKWRHGDKEKPGGIFRRNTPQSPREKDAQKLLDSQSKPPTGQLQNSLSSRNPPSVGPVGSAAHIQQSPVLDSRVRAGQSPPPHSDSNAKASPHCQKEEVPIQEDHRHEDGRPPFTFTFSKLYNIKGLRNKVNQLPGQSKRGSSSSSSSSTPVQRHKSTS